jgi:molybdopterin-guanine dinucleotide biosynthesis protein A
VEPLTSQEKSSRRTGAEAIVAVLAGGRATRLGGDKTTVVLAGRPLIEYPLRAAGDAGLAAVVVAKADSALPPVKAEVVIEPEFPAHPLLGIVTALRHARGRPVLALACDLPLIGPDLLFWLATRPESLVVPSVDGSFQPLAALYGPELLPDLEAGLLDSASMQGLVGSLRPRVVGEEEIARFQDPARAFTNVNEPGDLERAAGLLDSA